MEGEISLWRVRFCGIASFGGLRLVGERDSTFGISKKWQKVLDSVLWNRGGIVESAP